MRGKGAAELSYPRAEGGPGVGYLGASSGRRVGSAEREFFVAKGKNRRALPCDKRVWLHPFHWGLPGVSRGGVQAPSEERVAPPPTDRERRLRPQQRRRAHLPHLRALPRAGRCPARSLLPACLRPGDSVEGRRE